MKVIELFSGIGSQTKALKNIDIRVETILISDWYTKAIIGYDLLHTQDKPINNINEEKILKESLLSNDSKKPAKIIPKHRRTQIAKAKIRSKNITDVNKLKNMTIDEAIDLLTYSFPCQDLSIQGKKAGLYEGKSSSMLWTVGDFLYNQKKIDNLPKTLLMENVKALLNKSNVEGWESWKKFLEELGYTTFVKVVNSKDFGVPQNRERVFAVSILKEKLHKPFEFPEGTFETNFLSILDKKNIKDKKFEKYKNIKNISEFKKTKSGLIQANLINYTKFETENRVFKMEGIVPTLTCTGAHSRIKIYENKKIREITPLERLLLMGFDNSDYEKLKNGGLSSNEISFLAGNSIVVPVLEEIFKQMKKYWNE